MFVEVHPTNPQARNIAQIVAVLKAGGLIVYPTDSCYALGCALDNKEAVERMRRIRAVDKRHPFSLMCKDLSEIANYAKLENWAYRLIKSMTPGPYTFILRASRSVPKRVQQERRKTIGIRVPDHPVTQALASSLEQPLISTTLELPDHDLPLNDPELFEALLGNRVDAFLVSGPCEIDPTTVLDLSGDGVMVVREGRGELPAYLSPESD